MAAMAQRSSSRHGARGDVPCAFVPFLGPDQAGHQTRIPLPLKVEPDNSRIVAIVVLSFFFFPFLLALTVVGVVPLLHVPSVVTVIATAEVAELRDVAILVVYLVMSLAILAGMAAGALFLGALLSRNLFGWVYYRAPFTIGEDSLVDRFSLRDPLPWRDVIHAQLVFSNVPVVRLKLRNSPGVRLTSRLYNLAMNFRIPRRDEVDVVLANLEARPSRLGHAILDMVSRHGGEVEVPQGAKMLGHDHGRPAPQGGDDDDSLTVLGECGAARVISLPLELKGKAGWNQVPHVLVIVLLLGMAAKAPNALSVFLFMLYVLFIGWIVWRDLRSDRILMIGKKGIWDHRITHGPVGWANFERAKVRRARDGTCAAVVLYPRQPLSNRRGIAWPWRRKAIDVEVYSYNLRSDFVAMSILDLVERHGGKASLR